MKRFNEILASALIIGVIVMGSSVVYADDAASGGVSGYESDNAGLELKTGSASGTDFTSGEVDLTSSNGKYLNYYVENNGSVSVYITISGGASAERTLKPGEKGHISVTLASGTKSYTCKAVPTPNGGEIDIYYKMAQRDVKTN
ncbi:MAG: hypothetical protein LBU36_08040 [Clostridiales bacterium]|jgi:hypothetical protein|nr:hypothetical protein [Clostridiales bacterium]